MNSLFHRLESEEDVSILLIPELAYFGLQMLSDGTILFEGEPLMSRLLQHCAIMNNRFLILDAPQHLHDELLVRWVEQVSERYEKMSAFGAIYYPWLCSGEEVFPPLHGICRCRKTSSTDRCTGTLLLIPVRGCTHSSIGLTNQEATSLAKAHESIVLVIKGLMPMGARTLSRDQFFNRLTVVNLNMIIEQIQRDTQWAVFDE